MNSYSLTLCRQPPQVFSPLDWQVFNNAVEASRPAGQGNRAINFSVGPASAGVAAARWRACTGAASVARSVCGGDSAVAKGLWRTAVVVRCRERLGRLAVGWWSRYELAEVELLTELADQLEVGLQVVDVLFFVFEDVFEEVGGGDVALVPA